MKAISDLEFTCLLAKEPVIVLDFWAPWCRSCQAASAMLEEVEKVSTATFAKINIDEHAITAANYRVQSLPTVLVFKGGAVVAEFRGSVSRESLIIALEVKRG